MDKDWLKGSLGDAMHALLCGAGHNLRLVLAHLRVLLLAIAALALHVSWQMAGASTCSKLSGLFRTDYTHIKDIIRRFFRELSLTYPDRSCLAGRVH
ncbi:hypothetical protein [Aquabacterium humicola]|uniref:hypothetical protein n=1 Tax=Aquabacterium humicola TaxID=3237377 RepID=UPI003F7506EA